MDLIVLGLLASGLGYWMYRAGRQTGSRRGNDAVRGYRRRR